MDFTDKLRLRGQAEEDRFFAELDRQLIKAMHEHEKQEKDNLTPEESADPGIPSDIKRK
ncbi:hypothetical protein [Vibrio salinus]|uniref:hypothetical protein n=1 Tax=Vibrio salinus TaxID=2899784 RepID=UPI001E433BE4|nr:hypothetical protein [Vibrio salinus]MCE0494771.1 hypothetical protein [Vibrio salinus]